jgi:hypothetical protein
MMIVASKVGASRRKNARAFRCTGTFKAVRISRASYSAAAAGESTRRSAQEEKGMVQGPPTRLGGRYANVEPIIFELFADDFQMNAPVRFFGQASANLGSYPRNFRLRGHDWSVVLLGLIALSLLRALFPGFCHETRDLFVANIV